MGMDAGAGERLDSWKEIAAYLGREVRTVQLWEKSEGLPIHRHQHSRQGSVYAFKAELDAWRDARKNSPAPAAEPAETPGPEEPAPPVAVERVGIGRTGVLSAIAATLVIALAAGIYAYRAHRASIDVPTSVVVLPFLDLSPEKDSEYFSDGLTEEVIDALSRVPNLRVVARTSAFAFKGKNADIREIGRELNVNGVIEGSVRKSGDHLRITAQLNRVSDGYHMWSRTYDRELRDVFAVQSDISQSIAAELRAAQPANPRPRQPTEDVEAYRLYQEGRFLFNKFEAPDSDYKAIDFYQQALARDPRFALAYSGIADAYSYLAENFVVAPNEVMPKAKAAAEKALELDDSSAEAHTSLGIVELDYERDRDGAQREFQRALQLNPGFAWARHWYAHSLEAHDHMEDGLREMRAALDLDPLSVPINWDVTGELICLKRYDEALRRIRTAMELFPDVPTFAYMKVFANYRKGDFEAAHADVEQLAKRADLANDPTFLAMFAAEDARVGRTADARKIVARLEQMRATQYVEPFLLIEVCNNLKDRRELVKWLERAREERSPFLAYARSNASYWGLDQEALAILER